MIKNIPTRILKILAPAFFCALIFSCKKNPVQNQNDFLYPEYFQLENGLSVFVKEDHKVPLAYVVQSAWNETLLATLNTVAKKW